MQLQPIWRRCGSTTGFENQIQSLVEAGFLTIRLFADSKRRCGPTLDALLEQVIPENGTHAGAHINLVSVPFGPPIWIDPRNSDAAQRATWLAQGASCTIRDPSVMQAAKRAHSVIAIHLELLGPALLLAPQARLLLDVPDDRVLAERAWALEQGASKAQADITADSMARVQEQVLAVADICTFVSVTEAEQLGPQCQRSATVPPRVYATPLSLPMQPRFDLLLTSDLHVFNVTSLRWFLDDVWLPYLAEASVSVAIAGRVGDRVGAATHASPPLLHFMGFVEDLEAVRSQCRLTVVPDRAGTGVSVKLLNALAVEHPVATTTTGLRGLESSVVRLIPAHDKAAGLAADILDLIGNTQHLEERRTLVREAQRAIHQAADYAELLMSIGSPTVSVQQSRAEKWAKIIAAAPHDPRPYYFGSDTTFMMSGCAWDHQVLLDGWHDGEPWGRWTDGATASLRLTLAEAVTEPLRLELDIIPSPIGASLSIAVEDVQFPAIDPVQGSHAWDIPLPATLGKRNVLLTLRVAGTVCPAQVSGSDDERILGIGVSAVRLCRHTVATRAAQCAIQADPLQNTGTCAVPPPVSAPCSELRGWSMHWCLGMPASGSTWMFNAVMKVSTALFPDRRIVSGFVAGAADIQTSMESDSVAILKSHDLRDEIALQMTLAADVIWLSIRDPRDCIASYELGLEPDPAGDSNDEA
jgi:hypothetical protein